MDHPFGKPRPVSALYLHLPFCVRKCAYCDFASWATAHDDPDMEAYAFTLQKQVAKLADEGILEEAATAYVGGGTPTMLAPTTLGALVRTLRKGMPGVIELSCEANPESLTDEHLRQLAQSGATRLSVGVQSLSDDELEALGRIHSASRAEDRVRHAVQAGFDVSLDLMCAIPKQSSASWQTTLERSLSLGAGHISVYPLQFGDDEPSWHDPEVQAERMEAAENALKHAGFARYEVASYAQPGKACRHNEAYWTGKSYLGLGTQAASMLDQATYLRLRALCPQLPSLDDGVARVRLLCLNTRRELAENSSLEELHYDLELLSAGQAVAEDLMLAMRMSQGASMELLDTAVRILGEEQVHTAVNHVLDKGLAAWNDERLVPTHDGWLLGNELYGTFWNLAPDEVKRDRC